MLHTLEAFCVGLILQGSELYLNLNACGKFNAHECIDSLLGRFDDINESLVSFQLELLTAVLVLVHRTEDRCDLSVRGKRYGAGNFSTVSLCESNDLFSRCVDEGVVIALELPYVPCLSSNFLG